MRETPRQVEDEPEEKQEPKEIREILERALKEGGQVLITQSLDKGGHITQIDAVVVELGDSSVFVEVGGFGVGIIIEKITRAKLVEENKE